MTFRSFRSCQVVLCGWRLPLLLALACSSAVGCSFINPPDRDLLSKDAGNDATPPLDASRDAARDVAPTLLETGPQPDVQGDAGDAEPRDGRPPDHIRFPQPDVGPPDSGADRYGPDGPQDAETDTGAEAGLPPEDCTDVGDEDLNGLADCADFACSGHEKCCDEGTLDFNEEWGSGFGERWDPVPSIGGATPPRVQDGWVVEFGGDGDPSALIRQACTPMALGVDIQVTLRATGQGSSSCQEPPGCDAGLVLTAALDALPGRSLVDDLGVRLTHEGYIQVTNAGAPVPGGESSGPYPADHDLSVAVTITPSADSGQRLRANVTVTDTDITASGDPVSVLEGFEFLAQKSLVSHVQGCDQVPGLMIAVEGRGDAVHVGGVKATTKRCINPSLFHAAEPEQPDAEVLTASRLGFGLWASGHLAAPSLLHSPVSDSQRWDLMVEATNAAWELETWTHVGYALGHAYASSWNDDPWSGGSGPKAGNDPPSCIGQDPGCPQGMSLREPNMFGTVSEETLQIIHVVYARQTAAVKSGAPVRYAIHGCMISPSEAIPEGDDPKLTPDDLERESGISCDSLRDPVLAPRVPDPADGGFWLFFTCVQDNQPSSIYAARLQYDLNFRTDVPVRRVLSPDELGEYAAGGVWGPEVVVAHSWQGDTPSDGDTSIYRIWFMARSRTGSDTVVAMAQGQAEAPSQPSEARLPEAFVPYEANPVLHAASPGLVPGQGACALTGLAVTPYYDDPARLRLLVARRCLDGVSSSSELIPLEQYWMLPWL